MLIIVGARCCLTRSHGVRGHERTELVLSFVHFTHLDGDNTTGSFATLDLLFNLDLSSAGNREWSKTQPPKRTKMTPKRQNSQTFSPRDLANGLVL
jgi:hypothetical protein